MCQELETGETVYSWARVTAVPILTERRRMRRAGAEAVARVEETVPPLTPVGLPLEKRRAAALPLLVLLGAS